MTNRRLYTEMLATQKIHVDLLIANRGSIIPTVGENIIDCPLRVGQKSGCSQFRKIFYHIF